MITYWQHQQNVNLNLSQPNTPPSTDTIQYTGANNTTTGFAGGLKWSTSSNV